MSAPTALDGGALQAALARRVPQQRAPCDRRPVAADPTAAAATPVAVLARRHDALCTQAVDPSEIAAGLESAGVGDREAREQYGVGSVFELAALLYDARPAAAAEVDRARRDPWHRPWHEHALRGAALRRAGPARRARAALGAAGRHRPARRGRGPRGRPGAGRRAARPPAAGPAATPPRAPTCCRAAVLLLAPATGTFLVGVSVGAGAGAAAGLLAAVQAGYLLAATVCLVVGAERRLLAVLLPGCAGAAAVLATGGRLDPAGALRPVLLAGLVLTAGAAALAALRAVRARTAGAPGAVRPLSDVVGAGELRLTGAHALHGTVAAALVAFLVLDVLAGRGSGARGRARDGPAGRQPRPRRRARPPAAQRRPPRPGARGLAPALPPPGPARAAPGGRRARTPLGLAALTGAGRGRPAAGRPATGCCCSTPRGRGVLGFALFLATVLLVARRDRGPVLALSAAARRRPRAAARPLDAAAPARPARTCVVFAALALVLLPARAPRPRAGDPAPVTHSPGAAAACVVPAYAHPLVDPALWARLVEVAPTAARRSSSTRTTGPARGPTRRTPPSSRRCRPRACARPATSTPTTASARPRRGGRRRRAARRARTACAGVFLDQVSSGLDRLEHYAQVVRQVRAAGARFVALNPGTAPHPGYVDLANLTRDSSRGRSRPTPSSSSPTGRRASRRPGWPTWCTACAPERLAQVTGARGPAARGRGHGHRRHRRQPVGPAARAGADRAAAARRTGPGRGVDPAPDPDARAAVAAALGVRRPAGSGSRARSRRVTSGRCRRASGRRRRRRRC